MKKLLAALAILLLAQTAAYAQAPVCPSNPALTCPLFVYGFTPSPAQWQNWWNSKQTALNYTPLNQAGGTMTGKLILPASAAGSASLNLLPGTAPNSPVNGDFWTTTSGLFAQINGSTIGPFGTTGSGTVNGGTSGQLGYYASSASAISGNADATISAGALSLGASAVQGSVVLNGSTSGTTTIKPSAVAGSAVITAPATTGNMVTTGDSATVSNTMLAHSAATVAGQTCTLGSTCGLSSASNSLSSNVTLSNTSNFFDGPSVAQGSTGTWLATGTVTVLNGTTGDVFEAKLWDGTTVFAAGTHNDPAGAGNAITISVSGVITSPAGNIRISVRDLTSTSGTISANASGLGNKDSTVTVIRIN